MKALLGTKIGMTQIISENGVAIPVTIVKAGPVTVTQVKTIDKDGYNAVQVAYGEGKNLSKAVAGHVKTAKVIPSVIREFRQEEIPEDVTVGSVLDVSIFSIGDSVDVTGTSKGKGFAGTVKRHNFNTSKKTHGGNGKRMAGRMGHDRVTVKNLIVSYIDIERNIIGLKGAVPGPKKGLVSIGGTK